MDKTKALPPESPLSLNGVLYRLIEVIGTGGASIVYKACEDGKTGDYVVIKEFFPHDLGVQRLENGSLCVAEDKKAEYEKRMSRAISESDIANILRHDDEIRTNNPWFLSYGEPIEANNTLYTIIATEAGDMLSDKIEKRFFEDKDFTDICDCILKILDALEPIHNQNYLHLDISPDNIHFSNVGVARLIDYNSALRLGDDPKNWILSFKKGYSARELTRHSPTKPISLSMMTDLYSVTAIFFELLVGRPPQDGDWSNRKEWELNSDSGYLSGASNLLVKKTNEFLNKGLSITASRRFGNVSEMKVALQELKELWIKAEVINNRKRPYSHFIGRKVELTEIDAFLSSDTYVFLEGMGGIGKSELSKRYAWEYRDKYDVIQFITFNENLMETIALSLKMHNFDAAKYEENYSQEEVLQRIFDEKLTRLQQCNKKTLIIVDNYNVEADDNFHRFIDGEYKVIFTSREKHDENVIEVASMESNDDLMSLFCEYYKPLTLTEAEEGVVRDIISLVLGHTMTVMLIASAMKINGISPTEMFKRLKDNLNAELQKEIAVNKEEISVQVRYQIMYQHILNLFNMERLSDDFTENENYASIMTNMAIVPYGGLEINTFYAWSLQGRYESENLQDIMKLVKLRWIQHDEDEQIVSLHPVISDVANNTLKPDSVKCENLINAYIRFDSTSSDKTYVEQMNYATLIMELASKRICDKTILTNMMLSKYSHLNGLLSHHNMAIDCQHKIVAIFEEMLKCPPDETDVSLIEFGLCETYCNMGLSYDSLRRYDDALSSLDKSIKAGERLSQRGVDIHATSLALAYNNRGVTYENIKKHSESLSDKNKSIDIYENLLKDGNLEDEGENCLATAYMNRSVTYGSMQMYDESYADNEKCIMIWTRMKDAGKRVNESNLAKALMNKSINEAKRYIKQNESDFDKRGQDNLIRGVMAFNKNKK